MTPYRFRKCPACKATFPGGELKPVRYGVGHWHSSGGSIRRCPRCGYKGFTQDFKIVKDSA